MLGKFYGDLQSITILKYLTFLTDLTFHLNILNLNLESKEQNISLLFSSIENYRVMEKNRNILKLIIKQ